GADREREGPLGNEFFRDGRYDSAIQCYTRGMDADPYNPVLPTKRAALFVCRRFGVAESDCNLAIALDGKYVKAYVRRAAARAALNKQQEALEGLKLYEGNHRIVQMKFLAMHITNQKLSFDIFTVGHLQNILMEHDLYLIS
uniref:RNA polymerase II-associated protein 3-like n=1 Tax=Sinocyclocheilus anshuiensis TaxID=1608454 RepID=A0A671NV54_9TELE